MTQSRLGRRRAQRTPLAFWIPMLLALSACSEAQEAAPPFTAPGMPAQSMPVADGSGRDESASPASSGAIPGTAPSEAGAGSDGATSAPANEGVGSELDRVEEEPGAADDEPASAGEPPAPEAAEPAPDLGQQIPTIAPPGFPAGSAPRLVPLEFVGPVTGRAVSFNVYLPPGYDSGAASYPVLYDLHGLTDSRDTNPAPVIRSFEAAMRSGVVGPLIVVFPQSFAEGYYADSPDGARPGETQMIRELIPYIDENLRTLAHRARRGVSGFSMGGFGALAYATKYPDRFSVGIGYDSALDTWETLVGRRAHIAAAAFGNDESYFDQTSPWANAARNAAVLTASSLLRIVPGAQYRDFNEAFRIHLVTLGIPHEFSPTDCPHDYNCPIDREGARSWALIQDRFSEPATAFAP